MGLTSWTSLNDFFSHAQLAANWVAIDEHDHTATKGAQIPAGGLATGAVSQAKIQTGAIDTTRLADNAVTDVKLDRTGVATHFNLAERWVGFNSSAAAVTRYLLTPAGASAATAQSANGSIQAAFTVNSNDHYIASYRTAGVYSTGAHAPRYRLQCAAFGNGVAPGAHTITIDLRTIGTPDGTAGAYPQVASAATVSSSSVVLSMANSTGQIVTGSSPSDFIISATTDTTYVLTAQISTTLAANSTVSVRTVLMRTNI